MFFRKTVTITVRDQNLTLEVKSGTNLYTALVNGNAIGHTLCKGNGQCGKCKVHISQKNMSKPTKKEQLIMAKINLEAGYRLACQTTVKDNMTVNTSEITTSPMPTDIYIRHTPKEPIKEAVKTIREETPPELQEPLKPPQAVVSVDKKTVKEPDFVFTPYNKEPAGTAVETEKRIQFPTAGVAQPLLDGLLIVQNKEELHYYFYSASIDRIAQEGRIEKADLKSVLKSGTLPDYINNTLRINDVERVIILTDQVENRGEKLFDLALYNPFDIGTMQCELISPVDSQENLSIFLRILAVKEKKTLFIPLDRLDRTLYFDEERVAAVPGGSVLAVVNLFEITPQGKNPVSSISDDLKTITTQKEFTAPDSISLPLLMKVAGQMLKRKLVNDDLVIYPRNLLSSSVPLEYVVKIAQRGRTNMFYLHRGKDSSLAIEQESLSHIMNAKKYIHLALDYVDKKLGTVDSIILSTPQKVDNLLEYMEILEFIPPRYGNITTLTSGDSATTAVKLFHEPDIRSFLRKNYGIFSRQNRDN